MGDQEVEHGYVTPGAAPPVPQDQHAARVANHAVETANVEPDPQSSPPVTMGNQHLVITPEKNKELLARKAEEAGMTGAVVITADEMRKVNAAKPGTFTTAEVATASVKPYDPTEKPLYAPGIPPVDGSELPDANQARDIREEELASGRVEETGSQAAAPVAIESGDVGQLDKILAKSENQGGIGSAADITSIEDDSQVSRASSGDSKSAPTAEYPDFTGDQTTAEHVDEVRGGDSGLKWEKGNLVDSEPHSQ